jgi:hypothetical protein
MFLRLDRLLALQINSWGPRIRALLEFLSTTDQIGQPAGYWKYDLTPASKFSRSGQQKAVTTVKRQARGNARSQVEVQHLNVAQPPPIHPSVSLARPRHDLCVTLQISLRLLEYFPLEFSGLWNCT